MSLDWLLVLPVIDPELAAQCVGSMRIDMDRVIVVDNSQHGIDLPQRPGTLVRAGKNLGVATSWNIGAQRLVTEQRDILIICSQAVCYGPPGGQDLIDQLHLTDGWGLEVARAGWHMVGMTRKTFEIVGPFDEGIWPGYTDDTDMLYRMGLAGLPSPRENGRAWPQVPVDFADAGYALSIIRGHADPKFGWLAGRYRDKWGGDQTAETFKTPWDSGRPCWWWPDSPYDEHDPWGITDREDT